MEEGEREGGPVHNKFQAMQLIAVVVVVAAFYGSSRGI